MEKLGASDHRALYVPLFQF